MPQSNRYYPSRTGDQVTWLRNFSNKISSYQLPLGYTATEITNVRADAARVAYILETVQAEAQRFAQAITRHMGLMEDGPGSQLVEVPTFALPTAPPPPANVLPGALRRIFAFVANLKTRPGYTPDIGADLGLIPPVTTENPDAVPPASGEARSGECILRFKKMGHLGVYIEGERGAETEFSFLAIDTTDPYNDTRPLLVAGQPEKRRYRMCFWDGEPTRVWSDIIELTYGG